MQRALRGGTRRGQAWLPDQAGERAPEGVLAVVSPERPKRDAALRHAPPRRTTMPHVPVAGCVRRRGRQPARGRSRGSAPPSPPSSGSPTRGPFNTPTLVSNWTQFASTFGEFVDGSYLAHAVFGYFMNGGGNCYVVRIGDDGTGCRRRPRRDRGRRAAGRAGQPAAGRRGSTADLRPGELDDRGRRRRRRGADRRHVQAGRQARRPGRRGVRPADHRAAASRTSRRWSTPVQADQDRGGRHRRRREAGRRHASPSCRAAAAGRRAVAALTADDYVGDVAERTGFGGLEAVDEVTMVAVPDLMSAYQQGVDRPGGRQGRPARR